MITTSRLQVTGVTGGPLRITGASLVNGAYELATAGGADYELQTERQTTMDNILFIPGIANPVAEIRQLLFGQGQPGGSWIPSLSAAMIAANTFGSGVEDILDLSGNNNPFSQSTPSSRAAWFREPKRGRVNRYEQTESFDNAYWSKNDTTVSGQFLFDTATNAQHFIRDASGLVLPTTTGQVETLSIDAKAGTLNWLGLFFDGAIAWFNLSTGAAGTVSSGITTSVSSVDTDGFRRYSITRTRVNASTTARIYIGNADNAITYLGTGTGSIEIKKAQFEIGALTAYQRVTTAFDVTESGQRDCYGVRLDGTDDWYERAVNFSGTDKVTLFVAMRRRSDAARGTVLELTSSIDSNNGAFHLTAPNAASATFGFESKGTTLRDAVITQAMGNPRIITAIGDIAGDLASIQVDNGTPTTNTGDQGSGNYANSTLYLGRRGGSSLSLNGDIFGVIAAGGEYTAATRQRVRTILSRITPTVNL